MWARLAIGLSLAIGMFLGIWKMAAKEEAKEAVFLEVCWVGGQAYYQGVRDSCPEEMEPLQWKKRHKTVSWVFDSSFDVYLDSHKRAVEWVNKELGFEALRMVDGDADIVMLHGSANEGKGAMSTSHSRVDGKISATITVRHPQDIRAWMLEEQHELLHALGLAHDRSGIMSESLDEPDGVKIWLLHRKDRKALQELLSEP
jgi:hypothetical protein